MEALRSADFDQPLIYQLRQQLEHIPLDHSVRSFVATAEFLHQVRYPDRGSQLAPDFTADSTQSVTATALQTHEDRLTGHVRRHWVGRVTYDRCQIQLGHA